VGGGERVREPEFGDRRGHAEQEQCRGLLGRQPAKREAVSVEEPAPAAAARLGDNRHSSGIQRGDVPVDRAHRHLEFGGQRARGHPATSLQQQDQRDKAIGAHIAKPREDR